MREAEHDRKELLDEEEVQLEKHDMLAMYLSGFLTIGLPCLILILVIVGVTVVLFGLH